MIYMIKGCMLTHLITYKNIVDVLAFTFDYPLESNSYIIINLYKMNVFQYKFL